MKASLQPPPACKCDGANKMHHQNYAFTMASHLNTKQVQKTRREVVSPKKLQPPKSQQRDRNIERLA